MSPNSCHYLYCPTNPPHFVSLILVTIYIVQLTLYIMSLYPCFKAAVLINLSTLVHGLSTHNILPLGQVPDDVGLGVPDEWDVLQHRVIQVRHAWFAMRWYSLIGQTNLNKIKVIRNLKLHQNRINFVTLIEKINLNSSYKYSTTLNVSVIVVGQSNNYNSVISFVYCCSKIFAISQLEIKYRSFFYLNIINSQNIKNQYNKIFFMQMHIMSAAKGN